MMLLQLSASRAWTRAIAHKGRGILDNRSAPALASSIRLFSTNAADEFLAIQQQIKVPRKFVPYPFQYREEKTLRVQSLTNLGLGVCRVPLEASAENDQRDWVIFVPNVIPGELVRIRIYRNQQSYSEADLLEIVEPSPNRVVPPCKLAEVCGGCQYQHMEISSQREWKTRQVQELLERIGNLSGIDVAPTVGTDETFHYRSKITPHYSEPERDGPNKYKIGNIGFYGA